MADRKVVDADINPERRQKLHIDAKQYLVNLYGSAVTGTGPAVHPVASQ